MVGNTKPIVLQRADPWCYMHTDGYYYFTGSVPEYDRIELRRAKSIKELSDGVYIFCRRTRGGAFSYRVLCS